jgi:hypothetical protein
MQPKHSDVRASLFAAQEWLGHEHADLAAFILICIDGVMLRQAAGAAGTLLLLLLPMLMMMMRAPRCVLAHQAGRR